MHSVVNRAGYPIKGERTAFLSAFAKDDVVIIENFPPHLFQGDDAVERWSQKIISWHEPPSDLVLKHSFGTVQDLRVDEGEGLAFLSVATHWVIEEGDDGFEEDGGWAFVLAKEGDAWKVRSYGWAVTFISE